MTDNPSFTFNGTTLTDRGIVVLDGIDLNNSGADPAIRKLARTYQRAQAYNWAFAVELPATHDDLDQCVAKLDQWRRESTF